uniref:Uncharacterized protein n=1 Tax=Stomoxys calcitrans TaxID=35570 RepID=A0A1I8PA37_STOCA
MPFEAVPDNESQTPQFYSPIESCDDYASLEHKIKKLEEDIKNVSIYLNEIGEQIITKEDIGRNDQQFDEIKAPSSCLQESDFNQQKPHDSLTDSCRRQQNHQTSPALNFKQGTSFIAFGLNIDKVTAEHANTNQTPPKSLYWQRCPPIDLMKNSVGDNNQEQYIQTFKKVNACQTEVERSPPPFHSTPLSQSNLKCHKTYQSEPIFDGGHSKCSEGLHLHHKKYEKGRPTPNRRGLNKNCRLLKSSENSKNHHQPNRRNSSATEKLKYHKKTEASIDLLNEVGSSEELEFVDKQLPVVTKDLYNVIVDMIGEIQIPNIVLTVLPKSNSLYCINVSVANTGQSMGDVYTTKIALRQAERKKLFKRFLTFFVINSNSSLKQKNHILGHSYAIINLENRRYKTNHAKLQFRSVAHNKNDMSVGYDMNQKPVAIDEPRFIPTGSINSNIRLKAGTEFEEFSEATHFVATPDKSFSERLQLLANKASGFDQKLEDIGIKLIPRQVLQQCLHLFQAIVELYKLYKDIKQPNDPSADHNEEHLNISSEYYKLLADTNHQAMMLEQQLMSMKNLRPEERMLGKRTQEFLDSKKHLGLVANVGNDNEVLNKRNFNPQPEILLDNETCCGKSKMTKESPRMKCKTVPSNICQPDSKDSPFGATASQAKNGTHIDSLSKLADSQKQNMPWSQADQINVKYPIIHFNLCKAVEDLIDSLQLSSFALTIVPNRNNNLYLIHVSCIHSGESLTYLYATEQAFEEAQQFGLFNRFLTFFIINSNDNETLLFEHSFEIIDDIE